MDCRRLEQVFLNDTLGGSELYSRLKPPPKIVLDVICRKITNCSSTKGLFEMPGRTFVCFVRFFRPDWRL